MEALKFSGRQARATPLRTEIDQGSRDALVDLRAGEQPAVYVIRNGELGALRRLDDVVDRGRKHKARQLSRLLLGHDGIPLVAGTYTDTRQLVRSVRSLLTHAAKRSERNVYVVGTDDHVFDKLWATARDGAAAHRDGNQANASTTVLDVLDLLPRVKVPPQLEATFVGTSRASQLVCQLIMRATSTAQDVLILGDTGTGKEIVAGAIHEYSGRHPFVHVRCGAFAGDALEGAIFDAWQHAGEGTIFLDEIGGLRLDVQAKVVRALEERRIRPTGARSYVAVPARVITATNRDLFALMQAGQFREDLYYRLRAFTIRIPPLRTHPEDIPILAAHFWKMITVDPKGALPAEVLSSLQSYDWPGNARELRAVLCNLHALFGRDGLRVEHVRAVFRDLGQAPAAGPLADGEESRRRVACLRHLRSVDEVLRACLVTLRPVVEEKRATSAVVAAAHGTLHYRLHELELLCLSPLSFNSEATFAAVYRLKGKLAYFHGLLETDRKEALRYWKKQVGDEFRPTLAAVLREEQRVVEGV